MYFTDGTLSSCTEMSLTSLKDIELCFQNPLLLSYNPDTVRIPILVLNFRVQHPRSSEPLKYPSLGHKR